MKKERLVILSDLWGEQKGDWTRHYEALLQDRFEIQYYDSCVLGDVDTSIYEEKSLHRQFVTGGIARAKEQLLVLEPSKISILAFSIGGATAWKAALDGLHVGKLVTVSATRLRHETKRPTCSLTCFFGEKDAFRPSED